MTNAAPLMATSPALPALTIPGNQTAAKFNLAGSQGAFEVGIQIRLAVEDIDHLV